MLALCFNDGKIEVCFRSGTESVHLKVFDLEVCYADFKKKLFNHISVFGHGTATDDVTIVGAESVHWLEWHVYVDGIQTVRMRYRHRELYSDSAKKSKLS